VYPSLLQRCRRLLPLAVNSSSVPARVALPVVAAALEAATALEEIPEEEAATPREPILVAAEAREAHPEEAAALEAAAAMAPAALLVVEAASVEAAARAELPAAAAASAEAPAVLVSPVRSPHQEENALQAVSLQLPK